jgi:hypothetical protein
LFFVVFSKLFNLFFSIKERFSDQLDHLKVAFKH